MVNSLLHLLLPKTRTHILIMKLNQLFLLTNQLIINLPRLLLRLLQILLYLVQLLIILPVPPNRLNLIVRFLKVGFQALVILLALGEKMLQVFNGFFGLADLFEAHGVGHCGPHLVYFFFLFLYFLENLVYLIINSFKFSLLVKQMLNRIIHHMLLSSLFLNYRPQHRFKTFNLLTQPSILHLQFLNSCFLLTISHLPYAPAQI